MLLGLSIRDVLLIDRLDIAFSPGLSVLTGETGAGKSILLDSLGLALGARAESGLVRPGAAQLTVAAEFQPPQGHAVQAILAESGLDAPDNLILRRVVSADGRSRAFVNDQATSVGLLRRLGDCLVEVHGQFESNTLLEESHHRGLLDAFGMLDGGPVAAAWQAWRESRQVRQHAEAALSKARADEDLLRHAVDELAAFDPRPGEEEALANRRSLLMHGEKLVEAVNTASEMLTRSDGVGKALRAAHRALERIREKAEGGLDSVLAALDRASLEADEANELLERFAASITLDPASLEQVEQRLFSLRAVARKHGVDVSALPALYERLRADLESLDAGTAGIAGLKAAEAAARQRYLDVAEALSETRHATAMRLDKAVMAELPPLKLERAVFRVALTRLPEADWSEAGLDGVAFQISTNPGMPSGPLAKIASGGERSRFMLALKVVLAASGTLPTLVFDEVDSGIGGAVAAAVGERLARLADGIQVLVVTYSPQVAARGAHHWHVAKTLDGGGGTVTQVQSLVGDGRREEVARMLAGAHITDSARAAAESLLAVPS